MLLLVLTLEGSIYIPRYGRGGVIQSGPGTHMYTATYLGRYIPSMSRYLFIAGALSIQMFHLQCSASIDCILIGDQSTYLPRYVICFHLILHMIGTG